MMNILIEAFQMRQLSIQNKVISWLEDLIENRLADPLNLRGSGLSQSPVFVLAGGGLGHRCRIFLNKYRVSGFFTHKF